MMKKTNILRYAVLAVVALLCFTAGAQERDSLFAEHFLDAMIQREKGNADSARLYLDSCLMINPRSAVVHFLIGDQYVESDSDTLALHNFQKAATFEPSNDMYQEKVAQLYINTGQYADAIDAYEKLYAGHHDRDDVLAILVQLYRQQKDYKNMIDALNRLEQVDGESDQLSLMRMNAYELLGDEKKAYLSLKGLADGHPNDPNFKLMLGNWLMQHSRQQEAYNIYTAVLADEPDNANAQSSMYDYYNTTGHKAKADSMMTRLLLGPSTPVDTRVQFLRIAIDNNEKAGGDSTKIVALIDTMQQIMPHDSILAQFKAAYYTLKKFPADSINNALRDLLRLQPDNAGARLQLVQNLWSPDNWKTIAKLSQQGMMYNPNEMIFSFFTGLSKYFLKDEDGAFNALKRASTQITDESSTEMVANMYSILGEIYHNRNMKIEAYAAYDSCLMYKPDDVGTLNNYAYYLSVENGDLKKAEKMSAKTIEAEPKNTTFLDTYAWIMYKQRRYAEAKVYIDQALNFSMDTDSVGQVAYGNIDNTIFEHAAAVYAELGDYRAAVKFLNKAIDYGGNVKALQKKIANYRKKYRK